MTNQTTKQLLTVQDLNDSYTKFVEADGRYHSSLKELLDAANAVATSPEIRNHPFIRRLGDALRDILRAESERREASAGPPFYPRHSSARNTIS